MGIVKELPGTRPTTSEYIFGIFVLCLLVVIIAMLFLFRAEEKGSLAWWAIQVLLFALMLGSFVSWYYEREQRSRKGKRKGV